MAQNEKSSGPAGLLRILGAARIWATGAVLVLFGAFAGWNIAIGKGGTTAALIACWVAAALVVCLALIDRQTRATQAAPEGHYAHAKHVCGPLMAFNVGLFQVLGSAMMAAAGAIVAGALLATAARMSGLERALDQRPFVLLFLLVLLWRNTRAAALPRFIAPLAGAVALAGIAALAVAAPPPALAPQAWLPFGWIGLLAALHFGLWLFLGLDSAARDAQAKRPISAAPPLGRLAGALTLLIAATLGWLVSTRALPAEYLGAGTALPLFDTARLAGSGALVWLVGAGTLIAALASADLGLRDAGRALFRLGQDNYLPGWFAELHPHSRKPARAVMFAGALALVFALGAPLDQVITTAVLSGLLGTSFVALNILAQRQRFPAVSGFSPLPAALLLVLCALGFFTVFVGYGGQLALMIGFAIAASLWFHFWRYRFVTRGAQFTLPWPRPKGF